MVCICRHRNSFVSTALLRPCMSSLLFNCRMHNINLCNVLENNLNENCSRAIKFTYRRYDKMSNGCSAVNACKIGMHMFSGILKVAKSN